MTAAQPMRTRIAKLAAQRWPWVVLLLVLAAAYFGSYVRYGIGFRDEGQTVALGAQRILRGEVPMKDVVLNYNVFWFFPVVALFKAFGVSYVLLRGYCLALSTLTAVLGFFLVEKGTRKPWLAFLVALVLVLIPGSPFKNYIPFLAVANTLALVHFALSPADSRSSLLRALAGGAVLGLSFLIRIDIALLFSAIWLLLLAARSALGTARVLPRLGLSLASLALLILLTAGLHAPFWADAKRRGYQREFAAQYLEKMRMLERPITRLLGLPPPRALRPAHAGVHEQIPRRAAQRPPDDEPREADKSTLKRATWSDLHKAGQNAGPAFVFLTYAPAAALVLLAGWGVFAWLAGWRRRDGETERAGLAALVAVGGALSTFPQFFFFRPDVPHLSEFMPGFLTASAAASGLMWRGASGWRHWRTPFTAFLAIIALVYVVRILPDRWAGTYTIRSKRTKLFTAENGVNVYVSSRELAGLTEIQRLIRTFAPNPTDYVVCYPYSPGINLLADRPTYERNVYVDNATRTSNWDAEAIARFEKFRPAVIVLSDWDINGTKSSRFSVWAVKTKTWIQTHYTHQGTYIAGSDSFEIYTREPAAP